MSAQRLDAGALARELDARVTDLAVDLLGDPTAKERGEWRWRRRGSLAVVVTGPRRGAWFDHEAGTGGDALGLVRHVLDCGTAEAIRWAAEWLGGAAVQPPRRDEPETPPLPVSDAWRRLWSEARDPAGTVVERYLAGRGLALPPERSEVLRFHPACPFKGERVPAMLALLRDARTNEPCGLHRTTLLPGGSDRDRKRGKAMLGRAGGAVIKIVADAEVTNGLGIAEGIETALAVLGIGWSPVWAAGSAGTIAQFPVLPGIEALTIFADPDEAGQRAARACAARWVEAGHSVMIRTPRNGDADWCDVRRTA